MNPVLKKFIWVFIALFLVFIATETRAQVNCPGTPIPFGNSDLLQIWCKLKNGPIPITGTVTTGGGGGNQVDTIKAGINGSTRIQAIQNNTTGLLNFDTHLKNFGSIAPSNWGIGQKINQSGINYIGKSVFLDLTDSSVFTDNLTLQSVFKDYNGESNEAIGGESVFKTTNNKSVFNGAGNGSHFAWVNNSKSVFKNLSNTSAFLDTISGKNLSVSNITYKTYEKGSTNLISTTTISAASLAAFKTAFDAWVTANPNKIIVFVNQFITALGNYECIITYQSL